VIKVNIRYDKVDNSVLKFFCSGLWYSKAKPYLGSIHRLWWPDTE